MVSVGDVPRITKILSPNTPSITTQTQHSPSNSNNNNNNSCNSCISHIHIPMNNSTSKTSSSSYTYSTTLTNTITSSSSHKHTLRNDKKKKKKKKKNKIKSTICPGSKKQIQLCSFLIRGGKRITPIRFCGYASPKLHKFSFYVHPSHVAVIYIYNIMLTTIYITSNHV